MVWTFHIKYWWESPNEVDCIDQSLRIKKSADRGLYQSLFQTKQDSAIKIQFIKAAIADNKSKWETTKLCVEIIIKPGIEKQREKRKTF